MPILIFPGTTGGCVHPAGPAAIRTAFFPDAHSHRWHPGHVDPSQPIRDLHLSDSSRSEARYGGRMPLVAAAVCPHPPLLVPRFAGAAASELDGLRAACRQAIAVLLGTSPDEIVVVGSGPRTETYATGARGALGPWGVPQTITLGAPGPANPPSDPDLPLSATLGAWLLGVPPRPVRGLAVATDTAPADCLALGAELVAARRTALLVMGDGTACRSE